ncbi:MAG: hypothetical protein C0514_01365 [Candidatus Puniceispirillum sp.]|nr:hypothetical protein [Candidatus Puniceispirillum sp.]
MQNQGIRVRVRVIRCVRTNDGHGGMNRDWVDGEERWASIVPTERVLPSQESAAGIVHTTNSPKQGLYKLYLRTSPTRKPFERIRWNNKLYGVISHELMSDRTGWDLMLLASLGEESR